MELISRAVSMKCAAQMATGVEHEARSPTVLVVVLVVNSSHL